MTADELEKWLKDDQSQQSRWAKSDGSGECISQDGYDPSITQPTGSTQSARSKAEVQSELPERYTTSSRKGTLIGPPAATQSTLILRENRPKDPSKHDADDIAHMRQAAASGKRHLAQEEKAKQDTDSTSYKSLKNWGHDGQKE